MAKKKTQHSTLLSSEQVQEAVAEMAAEIDAHFAAPQPVTQQASLDEDMQAILGGMRPEDYLSAVYQGIEDAIGDADIYTVAAALDMTVAEMLAIARNELGQAASRDIAIKFAETILPYTVPLATTPYKRLRQP
ncbi:MAG: hypothetical protein H0U59_09455 [Gemmatimonadaceae bacterium]|nr:hypothetical protein [Gemmatimonadaceae bacterium]